MAEMKTKPTDQSVAEFLNEGSDEERRAGRLWGRENHGGDYGREAEDVGTEHRRLRQLSLQICERARRRLARDWFLTAQKGSDLVPHDGLPETRGADGEAGQAQCRPVVPSHQTPLRFSRADT